jgi:AraC-like DNA-binding protein
MRKSKTFEEITPLSEKNCFIILERTKRSFHFPLHVHPECELNLIEHAKGALRIVGDSEEEIGETDLVFIANPQLEHAWVDHKNNKGEEIHEITIQLHPEFLVDQILEKEQFASLHKLFQLARNGVTFPPEAICHIRPMIQELQEEKNAFYAMTKLLSILYELSISKDIRQLASTAYTKAIPKEFNIRMQKVVNYIHKRYDQHIYIADVAAILHISPSSFSRFIRKHTSKSFVEFLTDIRLGIAAHLLLETEENIVDICFKCGFANLSNFNRCFKRAKGMTPTEFRRNYQKHKEVI